jgi:LPXTG-motif cell wall-anchored protein
MRKLTTILTSAMVFVTTTAGTAFAQYTESPPPEAVVQGAGGAAGQGAAADTAFTGGDASMAVMVALALVAIGLVALVVARRRAAASS